MCLGFTQPLAHFDDLAGDFAQTLLALHGAFAQQAVRFVFGNGARLHQNPLGLFHPLPVRQAQLRFAQFFAPRLNFFLGQVMKSSGGKADPAALREILGRLLA